MKLLIVEDEIYSRQSLVKQVRLLDRGHQFTILEAANGRQGLEVFQREHPQLVLSDIKMPFLNGLELLKQILEQSPDTRVIMVSGYADFQYAQDALNLGSAGYLLKPVDDGELEGCLQKFLQQSARKAEDEERQRLLSEKDLLTNYLSSAVRLAELPEDFVNRTVFERLFERYQLLDLCFSGGRLPAKGDLYTKLQQIFCQHQMEFRLLNLPNNHWGIIMRETGCSFACLRRLENCFDEHFPGHTIGVSGVHSHAEQLREAYQEAASAVKHQIFYNQRVLYYDDVIKKRDEAYVLESQRMELIQLHLEKADERAAFQQIDLALDPFFEASRLSAESLESFLLKLTTVLQELLVKHMTRGEKLKRSEISFQLYDYGSREDLRQAVRSALGYTTDCLKKFSHDSRENIVDKVIGYINQNYNRDLSLKDMAENVFFLNHTYLSHLISETTGKSYSSYLREIRIKKAREYLKNKALSITEVATLSGYNDTSQFIQTFKKEVGMTPKKFRDLPETGA